MEPSNNKYPASSKLFILTGLLLLSVGMMFGLIGMLQYLIPGFLKQYLSFEKIRPLHVSSVVFWIIFGAIGSVINYVQQYTGRVIYSQRLVNIQWALFVGTTILILVSYCLGMFGGREYWEFPPVLALPIIAGWLLFSFNVIKSMPTFRHQPVYVWMWLTGVVFFLFTFLESYLWVFPSFRNNIVNDMTIQWKSYGSMVGAWNMLIYGCSIYLMEKISGDKNYGHSTIAFALYFTGLFNLMFNWGHHIYTLPSHHFIQYISYAVSMTELGILGRILWKWKSSLSDAKKHFHYIAFRFLVAADWWIFLSLLLAIMMSIPGVNLYTHGTHITVAHTMGTTIGINTFLVLAIAFDILHVNCFGAVPYTKYFNKAYWLANISLFVFWIALILVGIEKAKWQMGANRIPFSSMMHQIHPLFYFVFASGLMLATALLVIIYPMIKHQLECYISQKSSHVKSV
jgi:nitric oxide reductase subunit B